jgi:hypothetical protein
VNTMQILPKKRGRHPKWTGFSETRPHLPAFPHGLKNEAMLTLKRLGIHLPLLSKT